MSRFSEEAKSQILPGLPTREKNDSDAVCYATNQNLDSYNALYALLQDVNQRKKSSGGIKLTAVADRYNHGDGRQKLDRDLIKFNK
uniref:Uncharacterized protein n=1 Tax=Magallana gigas TaxID=29159 RepID=K1QJH9_MAGGI